MFRQPLVWYHMQTDDTPDDGPVEVWANGIERTRLLEFVALANRVAALACRLNTVSDPIQTMHH